MSDEITTTVVSTETELDDLTDLVSESSDDTPVFTSYGAAMQDPENKDASKEKKNSGDNGKESKAEPFKLPEGSHVRAMHYGSVHVEWFECDRRNSILSMPEEVRVFYRKEKNKLTDLERRVTVAYIHDQKEGKVYYQSSIFNADLNGHAWRREYKHGHVMTALHRLANKPYCAEIPAKLYEGHLNGKTGKPEAWKKFQDLIRAELHMKREYYRPQPCK